MKRAALGVLLFTLVFMRPVFTEGVTIFAEKRAEQIQKFMQPLIDSLITSPSDATKPGGPPND